MAKGQKSFAEKARKQAERKEGMQHVRVIKSVKDPDTGAVRFLDRVVAVPGGANMDEHLSKVVAEKD